MAPMQRVLGGPKGGDNPGKPSPEVGQDLADVVAAGAENGKYGVANGAFQGASRQAAVGFHVSDLGLDGASAAEVRDQFGCQAATGATDQHAGAPALSRCTSRPHSDR